MKLPYPFFLFAFLPTAFAFLVCFLSVFTASPSGLPGSLLFLPMGFFLVGVVFMRMHQELQFLHQRVNELESGKSAANP